MHTRGTVAVVVAVTLSVFAGVRDARAQAGIAAPIISSVTPAAPSRGTSGQLLTVSGSSFSGGVSLNVVGPDGQKANYAGSAIQTRRESSFQVSVVLAAAGTYTLTAVNSDGAVSQPFTLKASGSAGTPRIERILPEQLTKDSQPQVLNVSGERFVAGMSVSLTDPIGTVSVFKGSAIGGVTATSFDVSVALDMVGEYVLMVTAPTGESSNSVTMKVAMRIVRR